MSGSGSAVDAVAGCVTERTDDAFLVFPPRLFWSNFAVVSSLFSILLSFWQEGAPPQDPTRVTVCRGLPSREYGTVPHIRTTRRKIPRAEERG